MMTNKLPCIYLLSIPATVDRSTVVECDETFDSCSVCHTRQNSRLGCLCFLCRWAGNLIGLGCQSRIRFFDAAQCDLSLAIFKSTNTLMCLYEMAKDTLEVLLILMIPISRQITPNGGIEMKCRNSNDMI